MLFVFCVVSDLGLISRTRPTYVLEVLQSGPPRLASYRHAGGFEPFDNGLHGEVPDDRPLLW